MKLTPLEKFEYNGARAMILLQEKYLRLFLDTWYEAKKLQITLPKTDDSDYESLETLLFHIFRASRGYITWICEKLELADPGIKDPPTLNKIENEAEEYLTYLLEKWRLPLAKVEEDKFYSQTYTSNWKIEYCIDAMLEHAVMHPIRHEFQLKNLIEN